MIIKRTKLYKIAKRVYQFIRKFLNLTILKLYFGCFFHEIIFLDRDFDRIWKKIENRENFALLRYADGEKAVMMGESIVGIDGWETPNKLTSLGNDLLNSLKIKDDRIFYGIACPCCDPITHVWLKNILDSKNITFSNIFVNKNYKKFIQSFEKLTQDAVVIANDKARNRKIGNLNVLKYYGVGNQCVEFWDKNSGELIEEIKNDFGSRNNLLYVVSAGPMSEVIIIELFKNNPNNIYIDFGSSVDRYIHSDLNRSYVDDKSDCAKRNCWMYDFSN